MKKNKLIVLLNWCLLFSLPIILLTANVDKEKVSSRISIKELSTSIINSNITKDIVNIEKEEKEKEKEKEDIYTDDGEEIEEIKQVIVKEEQEEKNKDEEQPQQVFEEKTDIIKTYIGKMSYYNANCKGCSGVTSTGTDISDGRVYYYDNTYGNVRIIAAGTEIKKWSIVRLKNTSLGNDVLAIVLDRGGSIGEGKTFLIDMLTNNQENNDGVENNIIMEVIREGK